jgi:two-component system heavy metal sensor histidine kinase CusS
VSAKTWSLARRLTGLYVASISFFVLAVSIVSALFVRHNLNQSLRELPHEELGELALNFERIGHDEAALRREFDHLASEHVECDLAWRVWYADGRTLEFGAKHLLTPDRPERPHDSVEKLHEWGNVYALSTTFTPDASVGIVIDGTRRMAQLREYELYSAVVLLCGLAFAILLSTFFFRRVSRLLAQVAEGARSARDTETPLRIDVPGAPAEIREIADALRATLHTIRSETQQARVFTAGLAHELRSPLQNLVGEVEVALLQPRDTRAYQGVLQSNLEELRSLGDAVDNLVTICSAGDTRRTQSRENFDLAIEAELRLRRERAQAERRNVAFELVTHGDTRMWGDREAILRAVRNVAANAIQWCEPGGHVRVEITGHEGDVDVIVDDDGPGVSEDLRAHIFEPFFRGPSARGRRNGYGLGLALARTAVEEQSGAITVDRSPTGGARFHLRLPRRSPSRPGAEMRAAAGETPQLEPGSETRVAS